MRNLIFSTVLVLSSSFAGAAQTVELTNNPFTPNPRVTTAANANTAEVVSYAANERNPTASGPAVPIQTASLKPPPSNVAATMSSPTRPENPTDLYLVGAGDILFVSIENVATSRGYYSIREDGTVELPIIGESIMAAGRTAAEIAFDISQRSKVFSGRNVEVKVREYASHRITVSGLVERSGDRFLQREAMPFFVIRAESGVDQKATHVIIRSNAAAVPEVFELKDVRLESFLVASGMAFEFVAESANSSNVAVYISGDIVRAGKYQLSNERTLAQLIAAAGGIRNDAAKVTIRRPGRNGSITTQQFDLKEIKKGKQAEPTLLDGDMVEIRK